MGAQLPGDAVRIAFQSRDRPGVLSEQGFCSVALQAGGGERDGAVVAAAVGPDGVGLLPAAKAIGHPPEPRAGLARPIQVRRDQEIETTASRVGNLRGTPLSVLKLRSSGAAVNVGPDLPGVGVLVLVACHLL